MPRPYRLSPEGLARKRTPAVRAKMSAARKAAWADPAVRAKMSAASKAALADPAVRAKMSAARKAAWADPAVRAKMSAASKAALADPARNPLAALTPEQRHLYNKLRPLVGREAALSEALRDPAAGRRKAA